MYSVFSSQQQHCTTSQSPNRSHLNAWLEITHPIAEEEIDFLCCAISKHIAQQIVIIGETDFNLVEKCH